MIILYLIISFFGAYLVGSIPTAYIVGKATRKIDLREHGSGNVGATNVFRVIGVKWGFFVLACDILKGLFVVTILSNLLIAFFAPLSSLRQWFPIGMGLFAITGHNWTVFLSFKGGKGIATTTGVFLGIFPGVVGLCAAVWGIIFLTSRYVSLASIACGLFIPISVILLYRDRPDFYTLLIIGTALALVIIYTHRSNIRRLLKGEEGKVKFKKPRSR